MDEQELQQVASQLRKPEGEAGIKTGEWMNRGNELMNQAAIEALAPEENDHILEIGMGNGFFVKDIVSLHPSIKYSGCDFSELMKTEAEKMNAELVAMAQAEFKVADVLALPYANNTFTKVLTVNTVYFWEDTTKAFAEISRVMKDNATLVIGIRPRSQMETYPFTKYGFNMFSKEEVTALLTQNGFAVTRLNENTEPDFDLNGITMRMENMVVVARKN